MKYVAEWFGFMALVVGLCGCASVQQAQKEQADARVAMQEHEHPARQPNETTVEISIQQPAWLMAGKAAFASGRGADSQVQATAAQNMATSQTNSKLAEAGKEGIKAGTAAIAAFGTGIGGLGVTTGGMAFSDLVKLLAGEQDLVRTHVWYQGPNPSYVGVRFDENENPNVQVLPMAAKEIVGFADMLMAICGPLPKAQAKPEPKPMPKKSLLDRLRGR